MKNIFTIIAGFVFMAGCVETFNPPEIEDAEILLVIDASVNADNGSGSVRLTESARLHEDINHGFNIGASVTVEDENNNVYQFQSIGNGEFKIDNLNLGQTDRIRLNVSLENGDSYQSEFVEYKSTPDIDSVTFSVENDGLIFYVFTHDPENKSIYYKWDYEETWEFNTPFYSGYKFEGENIVYRDNAWDLYVCYKFNNSSHIIIGSSEKLQKDVISEFPVARISAGTGKFARKYSILIKQRALTKSAYEYWQMLKTNTESLGGLFDPQPSAINSNIKNVSNPSELVLGYFHVYDEKQKRVFIGSGDVPYYRYDSGYGYCQLDTVLNADLDPAAPYLLSSAILSEGPAPIGYTVSSVDCIDCRLKGTNEKPAYWE